MSEEPDAPGRALARPRAVASAWFGLWGTAAAGLIYLVPALDRGDVPGLLLFVLLPGVAGALAGGLVGARVLAGGGVGPLAAAGLGLATALVAHLVFAPVMAAGWWILDPEGTSLWGMTLAAVGVGLPAMGPVTLPAGTLAGWLLHLLGRGP